MARRPSPVHSRLKKLGWAWLTCWPVLVSWLSSVGDPTDRPTGNAPSSAVVPGGTGALPPLVVPEVEPDVLPDVLPDVPPDVLPEVEPEVLPDVLPDVPPDVLPEVAPDALPDVEPELLPPPALAPGPRVSVITGLKLTGTPLPRLSLTTS